MKKLVTVISEFNIGVEVFLLMSGIGLYYSLNNKKFSFKEYYIKRVLNVYLITLIVDLPYVIYSNLIFENKGIVRMLLEWTGLLNWTGQTKIAWYVMFAMVLYAIYPFIFKIVKYSEDKKYFIFALIAFCSIWYILCIVLNKLSPDLFAKVEIAVTRIPIFVVGCFLGPVVYYKKDFSILTYLIAFMGIFGYIVLRIIGKNILLFTRISHFMLGVAFCLVLSFVGTLLKNGYIYRFISWIGGMSLELYLIHIAVYVSVCELNNIRSIKLYIILIPPIIVFSALIAKFRKYIMLKYTRSLKEKNNG